MEGNEVVDEEAKKAHSSSTSKMNDLPFWMADYEYSLPYSSSALKQTFNRKLTAKWKEHWKKSLRYHQITKIDPTFPSKKYHQLVGGLTKAQASLITQLRIGHVQLNTFLHCIKKTASLQCPKCHQRQETVHHYLFECDTYRYDWYLLSKAVRHKATDLKCLLNNGTGIHETLKYIGATKRFQELYGDVTPIKDDEISGVLYSISSMTVLWLAHWRYSTTLDALTYVMSPPNQQKIFNRSLG